MIIDNSNIKNLILQLKNISPLLPLLINSKEWFNLTE